MVIPQHPFRSLWQPIEVIMMVYRIVDTIEGAALEAIYLFCNQHPREVAGQPIGLFSNIDPKESEWNLKVMPESHRLEGPTEEALRGMMRFVNVQYHYQMCGRTNLNYTGSSTRVHSRGLRRASNGITSWPVG
jgi:hypothetical protein